MEKLSLFLRTEEEFDKAVEREALEATITLQREELIGEINRRVKGE